MTTPQPPTTPPPEQPGGDPWLPAKLAAIYLIASSERDTYQGFQEMVKAFLAYVRPRVLRKGHIDPTGVLAGRELWRHQLGRFVNERIRPVLERAYRASRRKVLGDDEIPGGFDQLAFTRAYIAQVQNKLVRVPDELFEEIRAHVDAGVRAGHDIPTIAGQIEATLLDGGAEVWVNRGTTVARTEVVGANNAGAFQAFADLGAGEQVEKVWLATHDRRTRDTHRIADGQRVSYAQPFMVGGFPGMHPGDKLLPPQESINCRCTALYVLHGEEVA